MVYLSHTFPVFGVSISLTSVCRVEIPVGYGAPYLKFQAPYKIDCLLTIEFRDTLSASLCTNARCYAQRRLGPYHHRSRGSVDERHGGRPMGSPRRNLPNYDDRLQISPYYSP